MENSLFFVLYATNRKGHGFSFSEDIEGIQTDKTPKINTFQTMRKEVSDIKKDLSTATKNEFADGYSYNSSNNYEFIIYFFLISFNFIFRLSAIF